MEWLQWRWDEQEDENDSGDIQIWIRTVEEFFKRRPEVRTVDTGTGETEMMMVVVVVITVMMMLTTVMMMMLTL